MTERVLPEPDVYATCPSDGRILEYYSGVFDAVYVCFNPFVRPLTISVDRFCPSTYPTHVELVSTCEPVSWSEILRLADLPSLGSLDLALKTGIGAISREGRRDQYANRLEAMFDQGIVPPGEGEQSPLLFEPVMSIFRELGHRWAWVGDEFCTERKLYWIDDLAVTGPTRTVAHANIFAPDKSLLWTVHWDSHFTFLCGSRQDLERAAVAQRLEGFFCAPSTEVFWSLVETKPDS